MAKKSSNRKLTKAQQRSWNAYAVGRLNRAVAKAQVPYRRDANEIDANAPKKVWKKQIEASVGLAGRQLEHYATEMKNIKKEYGKAPDSKLIQSGNKYRVAQLRKLKKRNPTNISNIINRVRRFINPQSEMKRAWAAKWPKK